MPHLPHGHFVSRKMLVLVVGRVSGQKARGTLGSHDAVVTSGLALNDSEEFFMLDLNKWIANV